MEYAGKKELYNFLKDKGYEVAKMKEMRYEKYRGTEWLKYYDLDLYSPCRGVIYVTVYGEDAEGKEFEAERSKYVDGVLNYQTKKGHCTIMFGKPYEKVVV